MVGRFRRRFRVRTYACGESWACTGEDGHCVVLFANESMSLDALRCVRDAHEQIRSPFVASVADAKLEGDERYVAFNCPAVVDLELLADAASHSNIRLPFASAVAFNEWIMDAFEAAHHVGLYLGALGWRNVLIGSDGSMWLFGFGANFPAHNRDGGFSNAGTLSIAPEVAFGKAPDGAADVFVAFALIRSLLPHVDIYPAYAAAAAGDSDPLAATLAKGLGELSADVLAQSAVGRIADIATLRARYRGIRALDPTMPLPDDVALRAFWTELVSAALGDAPPPSSRMTTMNLRIDRVGRTARVDDGPPIDLRRRKALWQLLCGLVDARTNDAGPLSVAHLQDVGWPDESMQVEAGRARVYVGVSTLRRLGLGDVIVRMDDGYLIDPKVKLVETTA